MRREALPHISELAQSEAAQMITQSLSSQSDFEENADNLSSLSL
jgi:hypothetical protein